MTRMKRELRRFERIAFRTDAIVAAEGAEEDLIGETRDISLGGMFIEGVTAAYGSHVTVSLTLAGTRDSLALRGVVRWASHDGIGVQFGLLGARETHVLTEIVSGQRDSHRT